jgi:hypothetical protein
MRMTVCLALFCASMPFPAPGQSPKNPFDKPPADVDDALRARVTEFYQDHITEKYRLAEKLVAEESKDGFYAASKPDIKDFKIGDIAYSDGYTKAKITIVAKMMITFMGVGSKMMDVPFPSYWKIDEGKWCWYIFNDPKRMSPFGQINPETTSGKGEGSLTFKPVDLSTISAAVKADRVSVKLGGAEEKVILTNSLPGVVKLSLDQKEYPGFEAKLDKAELNGGEKAVLTLIAKSGTGPTPARTRVMVGVAVQPVNQLVEIEVK